MLQSIWLECQIMGFILRVNLCTDQMISSNIALGFQVILKSNIFPILILLNVINVHACYNFAAQCNFGFTRLVLAATVKLKQISTGFSEKSSICSNFFLHNTTKNP